MGEVHKKLKEKEIHTRIELKLETRALDPFEVKLKLKINYLKMKKRNYFEIFWIYGFLCELNEIN